MLSSANLTVLKGFDGVSHSPAGAVQSVNLQYTDSNNQTKDMGLVGGVLVAFVSGSLQEIAEWQDGAIGATKIINSEDGTAAYVTDIIWNVKKAQHPCCGQGNGLVVTATHGQVSTNNGTVALHASASIGSGSITGYQWTVQSKPSGATVTFNQGNTANALGQGLDTPGNYTFLVTVTADDGTTATASTSVSVAAPVSFDTTLEFSTGNTDSDSSVTGTIEQGQTSSVRKFEFNKILNTTGLPIDMTVYKTSVSAQNFIMDITYAAEYANQQCRVTQQDGTQTLTTFLAATGDKLL